MIGFPAKTVPRSKILFLIRSLEAGGAERQLVILARALAARGHEAVIVTYYAPGAFALSASPVRVISLSKSGRWDIVAFLYRLVHTIRREDPDVIHSYLTISNVLVGGLRPLLGRAKIVWGVRASDVPFQGYGRLTRLSWWLERALSRSPDAVIANSEAGRDFIEQSGFARATLHVIPNGIDTDQFRPAPELRAEGRKALGVDESKIAVAIVGRVDPMKGHETFLRAAKILSGQFPQMRFFCIGREVPDHAARMKGLARNLGLESIVSWLPPWSDPGRLYNALDLVCSSSNAGEGFSNVIGEAMACGTPCAVTDVGDSARIVGDASVVAPRNDPGRLAAAIVAGLKQRMSAAERRQRIVGQFSVERLVTRTEQVLFGTTVATGEEMGISRSAG